MTADAQTILEWTYEPKDFFEEVLVVSALDGQITFEDGTARGVFPAGCYDGGRSFRDAANEVVQHYLLAQLVSELRSGTAGAPRMSRQYSDGRRDVTVFPETAVFTFF